MLKNKQRCITVICVSLFVFGGASLVAPVEARKDAYGFDDNRSYDIHFNDGKYGSSVIKRVEIKGLHEIAGRTFLIIKSKEFKLQESEGFILFDSITAILPEDNFRLFSTKKKFRR